LFGLLALLTIGLEGGTTAALPLLLLLLPLPVTVPPPLPPPVALRAGTRSSFRSLSAALVWLRFG